MTVLVTGASRGLGKEIATHLTQAGYTVVHHYHTHKIDHPNALYGDF